MRRTGDAGLVRLMVDLARRLGHHTVAEGAETEDDVLTLAGIGCASVQGFYFSPALAEDELLEWLALHDASERPAWLPPGAARARRRPPGRTTRSPTACTAPSTSTCPRRARAARRPSRRS